MPRLTLHLLGSPQIELDGVPLDLEHHKPVALVTYLAVTGQMHSRQKLAALLWPEYAQARSYLRNNLAIIRRALGEPYSQLLQLDRSSTIGFLPTASLWLDTVALQKSARGCPDHRTLLEQPNLNGSGQTIHCEQCKHHWQNALDIYQGKFLEGFTLRDSPAFDEWQRLQRLELRRVLTVVLQKLLQNHLDQNNLYSAIPLAHRWTAIDPTHEPAHRHLMQLYAWTDQGSAALHQYQDCVRILSHDLDAQPDAETQQLFEAIKSKKLGPPPSSGSQPKQNTSNSGLSTTLSISSPERQTCPNNLPHFLVPLVGRHHECDTLVQWLTKQTVRLVTITGPGGVGKTRLAVQVAKQLQNEFIDGIYFVSLAQLRNPALIASTIGQTVGVQIEDSDSMLESLKNTLATKQILLVLDNFEHLLSAASLVTELLAACPNVKVLATSREMLNLRGEHEFIAPLLRLPADEQSMTPAELMQHESIQFFLQYAQAVNPNFVLNKENGAAVAAICTRLDGLPLALELAAAQVKHFSPQILNQKLAESKVIEVLRNGTRDMPKRHQTLRQALAWSVDLLDEETRELFCKLGVFVGSFTLESAIAICARDIELDLIFQSSASISRFVPDSAERTAINTQRASWEKILPQVQERLLALINKSLVRRVSHDSGEQRFVMLETIREYALDLLRENEELEIATRHYEAYFFTLAIAGETELESETQVQWIPRLISEYHHFRDTLSSVISNGDVTTAMRFSVALYPLWLKKGYDREAAWYLTQIESMADTVQPSVAASEFYFALAMTSEYSSDWARTESLFKKSLEFCRSVGNVPQAGYALSLLCHSTYNRGDYAQADTFREQAHAIYHDLNDEWGYYFGMGNWGVELAQCHQLEEGRSRCEEALANLRRIGDQWGLSMTLRNCGQVALWQGHLDDAQRFAQEGLSVGEAISNSAVISGAHRLLAEIALQRCDILIASRHLSISLAHLSDLAANKSKIQKTLETYISLFSVQRQPLIALQLAGMVATQRGEDGLVLPPLRQKQFDESVTSARLLVGIEDAEIAWADGEKMTMEEAIELITHPNTKRALLNKFTQSSYATKG